MAGLSHNQSAPRFRALIVALGLIGTWSLYSVKAEHQLGVVVLVLAALAFLTEAYPLELPGYGVVSGLESVVLTSLLLQQPVGTVVVLVSGLLSRARRRGKSFRLSFSLYSLVQMVFCYAAPFALLQTQQITSPFAYLATAVLSILADHLFAAYHLYLLQDKLGHFSTRLEWSRVRLSLVAHLPLGFLLANCLELGPVATILLLVPLAIAFRGLKTYVDTLREAREVVASMVEAVERRESGSEGHAERVAGWAGSIAREMGLREVAVRRIVSAARMHDLGKIGIEESVLNKADDLSAEEMTLLRRHPEVGARVASHLSLGKQEAEFIFHHHENFDGSGYPMGLSGQQIPQGARILAVAEAFDSMVFHPRRSRLTPKAALAELESAQGQQFDPTVVAAFKTVLRKKVA